MDQTPPQNYQTMQHYHIIGEAFGINYLYVLSDLVGDECPKFVVLSLCIAVDTRAGKPFGQRIHHYDMQRLSILR